VCNPYTSIVIGDNACACGNTICSGNHTCSSNKCSQVTDCVNTLPTTQNSIACKCGTAFCGGYEMYCDADLNICVSDQVLDCDNRNPGVECMCGSTMCTGSKDLCINDQCVSPPACKYDTLQTHACYCQNAQNLCSGDLIYCSSKSNTCIQRCDIDVDPTQILGSNECECGSTVCTGNNQCIQNVCTPIPPCAKTIPLNENHQACVCGTAVCDADSGM